MIAAIRNSLLWSSNIYLRAAAHIAVSGLIAISILLIPQPAQQYLWLTLALIILVFEILRLHADRVNGLFFDWLRPVLRPDEWWHPSGAYYVLMAAAGVSLLYSREIAAASICLLAVGDATSGIIGGYLGNIRQVKFYRFLGCLGACLAAGFVLLRVGLKLPATIYITGATVTALVDAWHGPINDNLLIPLLAGGLMTLLM